MERNRDGSVSIGKSVPDMDGPGKWERVVGIVLVFLLVVLFLLFVVVMLFEPRWVINLFGAEKFEILEFVALGIGGDLLALQVLISHKRAYAMEVAARAQAKATKQQARANENAEKGQRQERLKNAIEHLGHQSDSVRLGGTYELVHLAEDIENFRETVLDILCAHIRRTTGEPAYQEQHRDRPSEEVQSLLTLLFAQKIDVFKDLEATLTGSWLIGAYLSKTQLKRADLSKAALKGAHFWKAELQGAKFVIAQLQGADLSGAQLQGAKFGMARLQGVDLRDVKLQGADLPGARLQGADLCGAELQGADLCGAELQGANLTGAWLQGVLAGPRSPAITFEQRIRSRIDRNSNLSSATFMGGMSEEHVNSLVGGLNHREANRLRELLKPHIGLPQSFELPEASGAVTGRYTKEEAEQWIDEYKKSVSEGER